MNPEKAEKEAEKKNLGASAISLGGGQFLTRVVSFFWITYLSKKMGPSDFGLYNIAMSFVALALPLSNFGVSWVVMRDAARHPSQAPRLFGTLFWIRFLSSLALWGVLMAVLPWLGYPSFMKTVFLLAGLHLIITTSTQVAESMYVTYEKTQYLWQTQLFAAGGWFLLGWAVLVSGKGLNWLFAAMVVNSCLVSLLHGWIVATHLPSIDFHYRGPEILSALREGAPIGGVGLLATASERFDRILMSLFCLPAVVGYYSLASMIVFTLVEVIWQPFTTVLYPVMSRAAASKQGDLAWICRKTILWSAVLVCPILASLDFVSPPIVHRIWGHSYLQTIPLLQGLAWAMPFVAWNRILGNLIITTNQQRAYFKVNLTIFLAAAIGNTLLLPRLGASAAVYVMVVTQAIQAVLYLAVVSRRVASAWEPARLGAVLLVAAMCFLPLLLTSHAIILFPISLGLFTAAVFGKIFEAEDRLLLKRWFMHFRNAA